MVILQNIIAVIFVLGVMILIHELGHFLAAKYFDVRVDAFSFGFGPRLFGKKVGETDYRVCVLPLGGYVKMAGEQPGDEHSSDPREFMSKPRWQRLIIAVMGPAMNIVLALALPIGLFMVRYERLAIHSQPAVLGDIEPDSPAAKAGLKPDDRIVAIDGKVNPNWEDVTVAVMSNANRTMSLRVERNGKVIDASLIPTLDARTGVGYPGWSEQVPLGVEKVEPGMPAEKAGLKSGDILLTLDGKPLRSGRKLPELTQEIGGRSAVVEYVRNGQKRTTTLTPVHVKLGPEAASWKIGVYFEPRYERVTTRLSFPQSVRESINQNRKNATLIFQFLHGIIERRMSPKALEGPIGIARLSGQAARQGFGDLVMLMSMISLNLGILNLLPIPILDGGVILMLLLESLMGRDISLPVKERIIQAGFVFLMLLFVFVIYNDIMKSLAPG